MFYLLYSPRSDLGLYLASTLSTVLNIWFLCSMHSHDVISYIKPQGGPLPHVTLQSLTGSVQDKLASTANKPPEDFGDWGVSCSLDNKYLFEYVKTNKKVTIVRYFMKNPAVKTQLNSLSHILNENLPLNFLLLDPACFCSFSSFI